MALAPLSSVTPTDTPIPIPDVYDAYFCIVSDGDDGAGNGDEDQSSNDDEDLGIYDDGSDRQPLHRCSCKS